MTRLYRITKNEKPSDWDFQTHWQRGDRPKKATPAQIERYQGFSTATSIDKARDKMAAMPKLGEFIAELDVPDGVRCKDNGRGHVDLFETTPNQVRGWLQHVYAKEAKVES